MDVLAMTFWWMWHGGSRLEMRWLARIEQKDVALHFTTHSFTRELQSVHFHQFCGLSRGKRCEVLQPPAITWSIPLWSRAYSRNKVCQNISGEINKNICLCQTRSNSMVSGVRSRDTSVAVLAMIIITIATAGEFRTDLNSDCWRSSASLSFSATAVTVGEESQI